MKSIEPLVNQEILRQSIPISKRELSRWVGEGCPSVKKGRRRMFRIASVFRWLKAKGFFEGDWQPED
jgi:phage terminase Nu1 subunit (DNA packaging protein)